LVFGLKKSSYSKSDKDFYQTEIYRESTEVIDNTDYNIGDNIGQKHVIQILKSLTYGTCKSKTTD